MTSAANTTSTLTVTVTTRSPLRPPATSNNPT